MILYCMLYLVASTYVRAERPSGEVLLFRRGRRFNLRSSSGDEETPRSHNRLTIGPANDEKHSLVSEEVSVKFETAGATFLWDNISYKIMKKKEPIAILDGIEGWVKPGTLTALMVSLYQPVLLVAYSV